MEHLTCSHIATRVDFHTATVFRTAPAFPLIHLDPDTRPLPDALLEEAVCTSPTSLLQLSVGAIECFNIFYRLHRLALAISARWICKVSRLAFSTLVYETEHMILSVPDYSRDFVDFDLETRDEQDEDCEERRMLADGASVAEALLAAAQIFVYAGLREIPAQAKIFGVLLERLRVAIDRRNEFMIGIWRKAKHLNTLLWVLVVASSVAVESHERRWWISQLSDVAAELGIASQTELEGFLTRVAWTDVFFGAALESVWAGSRMARHTRERGHEAGDGEGNGDGDGDGDGYGDGKTIDPRLLLGKGRWKVSGWHV